MNEPVIMERPAYHKWVSEQTAPCILCNAEINPFVLRTFDNWVWVGSIAPYWEYHSMLIPKRHVELPSQLNGRELTEGFQLIDEIIARQNDAKLLWRDGEVIENWWFMWRFRQRKGTHEGNRTIDHLHLHILPDRDHHIDPMINYDGFMPRREEIESNLCKVGKQLFSS